MPVLFSRGVYTGHIGRSVLCVALLAGGGLVVPAAHAQVIANRAALSSLLTTSTTENFEKYAVRARDADVLLVTTLDSTTVIDNQGPGLVVPGITLSTFGTGGNINSLQWNATGYFGLSTQTFLSEEPGLRLDFAQPVGAFGIDLEAFSGFANNAVVTVYAADRTTVISTSPVIIVPGPAPVFYGYQSAAGIGRVDFLAQNRTFGNVVDNLTFGSVAVTAAAPEPGTLALLLPALPLAGLVLRRRRSESVANR